VVEHWGWSRGCDGRFAACEEWILLLYRFLVTDGSMIRGVEDDPKIVVVVSSRCFGMFRGDDCKDCAEGKACW
jgi:hypothetical protein